MTGTGTAADPFVPGTWAEFVTAAGTSGAYVELPENTVWDMNDIAPEGVSVSLNCTKISGNGAVIKNLFAKGKNAFTMNSACELSELSLLDLLLESGAVLFKVSTGASLQKCRVSGVVADSTVFQGSANSGFPCERSSFDLLFSGDSLFSNVMGTSGINGPSGVRLSFCNLKFGGVSTNSVNPDNSKAVNFMALSNTLLTGSDPFKHMVISNWYASGYYPWTFRSEYSVIDMELSSGNKIENLYDVSLSKVLVNSDKTNGASILSGVTYVTSEQLTNAEYLQSIGFPIGVD